MVWIVAIVVLADLWVRFAPSSVAKWHVATIDPTAPIRLGYLAKIDFSRSANEILQALDVIARATPRTGVLAGSVADNRITYITRTRVWGFPDYTTVIAEKTDEVSRLTLYGRLRFGYSDGGVNRRRIEGWIKVLEPLQ